MAFGNKSLPTVQYTFDLKGQPQDLEWLDTQFSLAHEYYNQLVRFKRDENADIEAFRIANNEEYAAASAAVTSAREEIDSVYAAIRADNSASGRRGTGSECQRERIAEARRLIVASSETLKRLRTHFKGLDSYREFLASLDVRYNGTRSGESRRRAGGLRKDARAAIVDRGLHWGTYLAVESALSGEPFPQFRRRDVDPWSQLAIQFQVRGGLRMNWGRAVGGADPRMRVLSVFRKPNGNQIVEAEFGFGRPVRMKFYMHREIPEDANITWVYLMRKRVGRKYHWRVNFVLSRESGWDKTDRATAGHCGLDHNWRRIGDELRVATWVGVPQRDIVISEELRPFLRWDAAKSVGTVVFTEERIGRLTKCRELQSVRDTNFDAMLPSLASELHGLAKPDWFAEAVAHLSQWQSQFRCREFLARWRASRFDGDAAAFDLLCAWERQELHLLDWQEEQARGWYAWRKWLYRNLAAVLRRAYGVIYLEGSDLSKMAKRAEPDQDENQAVREWRAVAASGEMILAVKETAARWVAVDPHLTSKRCSACGHRTGLTGETNYVCEACGAAWDCDVNACLNIIRAGLDADRDASA